MMTTTTDRTAGLDPGDEERAGRFYERVRGPLQELAPVHGCAAAAPRACCGAGER